MVESNSLELGREDAHDFSLTSGPCVCFRCPSASTGEPTAGEWDIITIWELGDALRYIRDKGNTDFDSIHASSPTRASSSAEVPPYRLGDATTPLPTPPTGVRPRAAATRKRFVGDGGNTPKTPHAPDDDSQIAPLTSNAPRESLIMSSPVLGPMAESTGGRSIKTAESFRSARSQGAESNTGSIKMQVRCACRLR